MTTIREIKQRIISVKKTRKITLAMKMVAAAKFKRATDAIRSSAPYFQSLLSVFHKLNPYLSTQTLPSLFQKRDSGTAVLIVVTSDRGLCGGFNTGVLKRAEAYCQQHPQTELVLIGSKAKTFFRSKSLAVSATLPNLASSISLADVNRFLYPLIDRYERGELRSLSLVYNSFELPFKTGVSVQALLPLDPDQFVSPVHGKEVPIDSTETLNQLKFEPSLTVALTQLSTLFIGYFGYLALLESNAAEEGARMAAMESASDNASDMIDDLTLVYNRTRQAAITTELTEIVSGAAALMQ